MSVIVGMAFNRKEFENRLWEKIAGGCSEYYKHRIAKDLLGWSDMVYVGKWYREVERLLFQELAVFYHLSETTFKDRSKVLEKVKQQIQNKSDGFKATAITTLSRIASQNKKLNKNISKKKLEELDIMGDFLKEVDDAINVKVDTLEIK